MEKAEEIVFEQKQWDTHTISISSARPFSLGIDQSLIAPLNNVLQVRRLYQFLADDRYNYLAFKALVRYLHQNGYDTTDLNQAIRNFISSQPLAEDRNQTPGSPLKPAIKTGDIFRAEVEQLYKQTPVTVPEDLQKGRWGGLSVNQGLSITASVRTTQSKGIFDVIVNVEFRNPNINDAKIRNVIANLSPVPTEVAFFLHNSFDEEIMYEPLVKGKAQITFQAYEAATIGVYSNSGISLELDLNNVTGFPYEFYYDDPPEIFKTIVRDLYEKSQPFQDTDIQKNRWKGKSINEGKQMTARLVKVLFTDFVTVQIIVESENPTQLTGDVAFFLSEAFPKTTIFERVVNGSAFITITSAKAFTVGACTSDQLSVLELDLNDVKGFPKSFYTRDSPIDIEEIDFSIPGLTTMNLKSWTNATENFNQEIDNLFTIENPANQGALDGYNSTTRALQQFVGKAIDKEKSIRVIGSGWSSSKIATTKGWVLETKLLNNLFTISTASIHSTYKGDHASLLFTQCGCTVMEINNFLTENNRSLKTSPANIGQTIAGLISTGSHGSTIDFGATQDFVVGLHIIISPERHVYLERSTYPVVSDQFIKMLNTELLRDDEVFRAALVSFGSFGIIHGVMIETEERFLLEAFRERVPFNESLGKLMSTQNFDGNSILPYPNQRPYHFQVFMDPAVRNQAIITVMYKRSYQPNYPSSTLSLESGADANVLLGRSGQHSPLMSENHIPSFKNITGTPQGFFSNTLIRSPMFSAAIALPADRLGELNSLVQQFDSSGAADMIFTYRFVKASEAILAFTYFHQTCIFEVDTIEENTLKLFFDQIIPALDSVAFPYTFHWGKINNLNAEMITRMYGQRAERWISARNRLLPASSIKVFNSALLREWGLDTIV